MRTSEETQVPDDADRQALRYTDLDTHGDASMKFAKYLEQPESSFLWNVNYVAYYFTKDLRTGFTAWLQSLPRDVNGIRRLHAFSDLCKHFLGLVNVAVGIEANTTQGPAFERAWSGSSSSNTAGKRVKDAGNLAYQMYGVINGTTQTGDEDYRVESSPGILKIWVAYRNYDKKLIGQESADETLETAKQTQQEWVKLLQRAQIPIQRGGAFGQNRAEIGPGPYGVAQSQMVLFSEIQRGLNRANAQLQEAQVREDAKPHVPPPRPDTPPPLVYMPPGAEDVDGDGPIADSKGDESDGAHALSPIREPVDTSPNMSTEEKTNPSPAKLNPQPKGPDSWFRADGGGYDPRQPQISWVGGLRRGVSFGVASKLYKAVPFWHAVLLGVVDGAGLQAFTHTAWNRSMYAIGYDPRGSIGGSSETQTDRESVGGNQEGVFVNNASAVGRPQGAILDTAVDAAILNAMKPSAKLAAFAVLANAVDQVVSRGIEYGMTPDASGKALFGDFKLSNASDLRTYEMRERQSMHYVPISEKKK